MSKGSFPEVALAGGIPTGSGRFARLKPEGFVAVVAATTPLTYSGPAGEVTTAVAGTAWVCREAEHEAASEKSIRLLDNDSFFDHCGGEYDEGCCVDVVVGGGLFPGMSL